VNIGEGLDKGVVYLDSYIKYYGLDYLNENIYYIINNVWEVMKYILSCKFYRIN
jgi:hypothetical protein